MSTHTYKKSEQANSGELPDKMTVYQDCMNKFNESPVNAKKCRELIFRLLRLLAEGETFPQSEATALFFSVSKLFQHQNDSLRQAVYIAIKELSGISEDALMATSSIMKDIQNGSELVRPDAIRSLTFVLDESTAFSAERLLKSAVVSKNASISSAALVTAYNLLPISAATIKRFANETQEAVVDLKQSSQNGVGEYYPSSTFITQFHALGLLFELKKNDKMSLMKLVSQFFHNSSLKNQLAHVQLIKICNSLIQKDPTLFASFEPMLFNKLASKHEAVQIESAKLITNCALANPRLVSADIFASTIDTLRTFLAVPRVTSRFAALRILNKISIVSPEKIAVCNPELESLINDSNDNISTYAITILLKTGTEANITSLISTIGKFIYDVSDDFKVIVIDAIRTLSLNFPTKWRLVLDFLIDVLKNSEGGFKAKNSLVEAIVDIISFVPESKELALENLCDFIEDCEFNEILVKILHLLGKEGPYTSTPSLYVRHIYNRVVLENSIIRSAAVVALSKFALTKNDSTLKESIISLLKRISNDKDDEVRDRATVALKLIESVDSDKGAIAEDLLQSKYTWDLSSLESRLSSYISANADSFETSFDASNIRKYTDDEVKAMELKRKRQKVQKGEMAVEVNDETDAEPSVDASGSANTEFSGPSLTEDQQDLMATKYADELLSIDEFKSFGGIINTSKAISLTGSEAEFVVNAVKHIFKEHIVVQFNITNTLTEVLLENVSVTCTSEDPDASQLEELFTLPVDRLEPSKEVACYVAFKKRDDMVVEGLLNSLTFTTKEIDPATNDIFEGDEGFQDEYEIDSLYLNAGDYVKSSFVGDFAAAFDEFPYEEVAVYNIQENITLQEMVDKLVVNTSCLPLENTQYVPSGTHTHTVKLFGKSCLNGSKIALNIKIVKGSKGLAIKAQAKSEDQELCADLVNGLI